MDFRDWGNDHRFFDIHVAPFMRDPFPVLEQLYDFLGGLHHEYGLSREAA